MTVIMIETWRHFTRGETYDLDDVKAQKLIDIGKAEPAGVKATAKKKK